MSHTTATPGLIVERGRFGWRIIHQSSGGLLPDGASFARNNFDTRKAARGAADRLGSIGVDFTAEHPFGTAVPPHEERERIRRVYLDALTDTTEEERRAVSRRKEEAEEHERRGGLWRDVAQRKAEELGHALGWRPYGQRSWIGVCSCGADVRVAYSSMQRRYQPGYGDAVTKPCAEARP